MHVGQRRPDSVRTLSEALRTVTSAAARPPLAPRAPAPPPGDPAPSPDELMAASPNLRRLCESYHRVHTTLVQRSRRQRLGVAVLVGAVGSSAAWLGQSGTLTTGTVQVLVVTVALASYAAVGALGLLFVRDDRRVRAAQGERLLRALQSNCSLPQRRLQALRSGGLSPTRTFFDCYELWRQEHVGDRQTSLLSRLRRA